jgi:PrtD family type I secretion system ABC transporter
MSFLQPAWPEPMKEALAACRGHLVNSAVFSALVNILFLAPTLYMMQVYDRVVPTGGVLTLAWLTVVLGLALGTLSLLDNIRSRIMVRASLRLNEALSGQILDRLVSRSRQDAADPIVAQAMREFDTIRQTMTGPGAMALFDTPWTPIYVLAAFLLHPVLGLLICIGGAILVGLAIINEKVVREGSKIGHRANATAYSAQEMLVSKAEIVRALGMRRALVSRQQQARNEGLNASTGTQLSATRFSALVKFVRMFLQSLSLGVAAWLAIKGQISSGTIIAASVLLSRALQPIEQLVGTWPQMMQARQSLATLKQLFEQADADQKRHVLLPDPKGYVAFSNVTLRNAEQSAFILRGVSFSLEPGEIVGVVGPSGAGKSTLARIAAGAIRPDAGEIRIDQADYDDWDPEKLATHIGYVPQDYSLLPGTISENISRFAIDRGADPEAVDKQVIHAAKMAGVHDMIQRLPDGYSAHIGQTGLSLSGGQTQRIALARALFGNPKVLILDEPSSALDGEGELALMRALEAARLRWVAVMVVAHRSQILDLADRLVVMNEGAVSLQGLREDVVLALKGASARGNVVDLKQG